MQNHHDGKMHVCLAHRTHLQLLQFLSSFWPSPTAVGHHDLLASKITCKSCTVNRSLQFRWQLPPIGLGGPFGLLAAAAKDVAIRYLLKSILIILPQLQMLAHHFESCKAKPFWGAPARFILPMHACPCNSATTDQQSRAQYVLSRKPCVLEILLAGCHDGRQFHGTLHSAF